ncbi:assimilatory sulfite reductase (NADPH) flavoprotein subunit [Aestuariibacter sp. A3R04]|uniref:assimilatory sulfite reductase (NADPH) flavoprotein subunit n=1 Tax=Aestuariibacter sp. A3R04 TaxID=2841571 RepID=UPI001C0889F5|nr:assimilatory sulfite reductase (NADPH) flavoprotein subunit [Aestuariibacter sp. A3R04]MBU3022000.1 assimilatory sulfite reductase (NADPH) flavoprotein subunit [Aestuariibacter sp. A3R04]
MSANSNQNQAPGAVLNETQWNAITQAIAGLNKDQLTWVSGYVAGMAAAQGAAVVQDAGIATESDSKASITVLFGSQTGNAKGVAQQFHAQAEAAGYASKLVSMADFKPRQLKNETHVAIFVSTHGEGDAPDDAVELHEFLASKKAPKLAGLKFAVLGLGDSSYEFFCQTGKDFDERLSKLGATAIAPRLDCDVDYEDAAAQWSEKVIGALKDDLGAAGFAQGAAQPVLAVQTGESVYTKKAPFTATLMESQKITGRDSVKDIRHIEISLENSGISYRPGDALGVWFKNGDELVAEVLALTELDGSESVTVGGDALTLRDALTDKLELTLSYPTFVKAYQAATSSEALGALLAEPAQLRTYLAERQIIDIIRDHPAKVPAQVLVDALRPMTPRLYSIASSQAEVDEEVHLTVAHVDYEAFGKRHQGGASSYLCERLQEGGSVEVYIEKNDNFRLPENPDTPVIMVGPGTGIAPFRAFMQERDAQGAEGKNWLFFGNPNFTQDFLYQVEWQGYVKSGLLDKITLAFSRDQKEKIYVQHRLLENGKAVYEWLESGAHFYVCGDATHMAKDVEEALLSIIREHGGKSEDDAKAYLVAMRKAKRYQKDVY